MVPKTYMVLVYGASSLRRNFDRLQYGLRKKYQKLTFATLGLSLNDVMKHFLYEQEQDDPIRDFSPNSKQGLSGFLDNYAQNLASK